MAEEFRHAGIGIDLNIQGLQQLAELNQRIDKTLAGLRTIGEFADKADGSIDKMTSHSANNLNHLTDDFNKVKTANEQLIDKVKDVQQSVNNIKTQSVQDLNQSFKNTSTSADNTMKAIGNVKRIANEISADHMDKLNNSTERTGKNADETSHKFKRLRDTAVGVFAGNLITNGIQNITSGLQDAVKQGLQFNATADDMRKKWSQAGLSSSDANAMSKQIADIRQHADISAQSISNMQKQYLVLTGSAQQARELTSTITSFGTASGLDEQKQNSIARLISSNKNVNARMFNRTLGQSPMFANEIIKQTGMSKDAFYSLLQSGKLTGQQLRDAMIKASKDSNVAWSDYAQTATGKMDLVKATISQTKKSFDMNLTSSMFDQINKIAGSSGGLNKLQKNVERIAKDVGQTIGKVIGGVVAFLAKNIKPIEDIGGAIWNIVKAISSGAWSAFTGVFSIFTSNTGKASGGLKSVDKVLTGLSKHQDMLKTLGKLMVAAFAAQKIYQFGSAIGSGINMIRGFAKAMKAASADGTILNAVMDANPFGLIALAISGVVVGLVELYKHFKPFRKYVNGLGELFADRFKSIMKVIGTVGKFIKKYFENVIKDQVKVVKDVFKIIGDVIRIFVDLFTFNFKDLGKTIPKLGKHLWNGIEDVWQTGADFIKDIGSNMWKAIWNTFKSWGKNIGKFFVDLWDGIKSKVSDGINGVTGIINDGIKGLNWVLSKVGGSGHTIGLIPKVKFAQGTMGGRLAKHTMAMLNDGNDSPETGNKEMAILPNGKAFIPQKRNWTGLLPKGTAILNATETKLFMMMNGINKFASGTGFFSGLWNGAKKVASAVAHPIKFISSMFGKLPSMPEYVSDLASGMANKGKNALIDWFKRFGGGNANNPVGSGVNRWKSIIKQAASFMKVALNSSDMSLILGRIAKESGGNPTITQQISDVNSRAGHPAQGLLQYVPSTFASWAVKGHTNLLNGYDQLLAMFNDSNWRRDIANAGGWGPTGSRARRNGGQVNKNHWYTVNEEGQELFKPATNGSVINHNDSKRIVNNANKPITINAPLNVTINGGTDDKNLDKKLHDSYEQHTRQLAEKLQQEFGSTNGGYFAI